MTIGEKIKARREELGMTTEELGKEIGVQRSAVSKYEKGKVDLKSHQLQEIARVLRISPCALLGDEDEEEERRLITAWRASDDVTKELVRRALHMDEKNDSSQSAI